MDGHDVGEEGGRTMGVGWEALEFMSFIGLRGGARVSGQGFIKACCVLCGTIP